MRIFLNEHELDVSEDATLQSIRREHKPDADIAIVNGFPCQPDYRLQPQDSIVLIRRGEQPTHQELSALMMARHTPGVHARISRATVGIAGAGGLGSAIAGALARLGVGRLIIADYDVIEPSNLNRQQYFVDQIGMPKVEALQQNLLRINPTVEVSAIHRRITADTVAHYFATVDVMTEAFDAAAEKAMLVSSFLQQFTTTPLVAASGVAGYGPANSIRTTRVTEHLYLVGDGCSAAQPGQGLMSPLVGIAAHHQANAVLRLLLGENPAPPMSDDSCDENE
ncbi:MAG: thiamine biosynthesis protein ThiF [Desulfuromonas sp.]|nr:MAG: thiamine biosynthesis protein ThiF [Desulfuromonas sp.]